MRKNQLRQQVEQYCKHNHSGSFRAKKHRHFVLHKMIRDLYHVGHVPPKWHAVTHDHIVQLVAHWQKEVIKPKTIMKYMTIIRRLFQSIDHT
ncbi:phage integrase N-terminal domain-containing protein, partial [Legionella pneumophila]